MLTCSRSQPIGRQLGLNARYLNLQFVLSWTLLQLQNTMINLPKELGVLLNRGFQYLDYVICSGCQHLVRWLWPFIRCPHPKFIPTWGKNLQIELGVLLGECLSEAKLCALNRGQSIFRIHVCWSALAYNQLSGDSDSMPDVQSSF